MSTVEQQVPIRTLVRRDTTLRRLLTMTLVDTLGRGAFFTLTSGSGKSTVAQLLQAKLAGPAAVLQQDYFHRVIFREQGTAGMAHAGLLEAAAAHCLGAGQHVVMDGIFNARQYEDVLARIAGRADDARFYAFDLTFEETVQRHASRPKALEFGVEEMRGWYHGWQPLSFVRERPIGGDESADQIAERILSDGPNEL